MSMSMSSTFGSAGEMLLDPCILHKKGTPLHVAAMKGSLSLVKQILSCNPQLAEELDAYQSSPLHVASSNGHLEVVRELLLAAPQMCLSQDCHGRNPVHVAAVKGQVEVLKELVEKHPIAARENTGGGLTLLHLCLKYQHLDAFKEIVSNLRDLLDCKDHDGNNVLHMAARYNQVEIVDYLVRNKTIDVQAMNLKGQTARAILKQTPTTSSHDPKILAMLKPKGSNEKWVSEKRDAIMVVGILIATMAFQAGVTPPGGVFQNAVTQGPTTYKIGVAVMAFTYPKTYKAFTYVNTTAFVMSLSVILLLISGLPFRRDLFTWILMVTMWLAITFIAATYAISIVVVTPPVEEHGHQKSLIYVIVLGMLCWICLMGILFGGNTVRLVDRWIQRKNGISVVELVNQWMHNTLQHWVEIKNSSQASNV